MFKNRTAIIIGILVILLLISVISVGFLYVNQSNSSNKGAVSASNSVSNSAQDSRSSFSSFSFPTFIDPNTTSSSANQNSNSSSISGNNNSIATIPYNITLKPKFSDGLNMQVLGESKCGENIYTVSGEISYQSKNGDKSMTIAHNRLATRAIAQSSLQQAKNFISHQTDFMSDGNTGYGPDFLQFLRSTCNQSNITKVSENTEGGLIKFGDQSRALITLQSNNNFPDVAINLYSIFGEHYILLTKTYKFDDFFSRSQFQNCSDPNGNPKRDCLKNLINTDSDMKKELDQGIKELVTNFAL